MPQYLLAHDFGTSGNKATLYSTEGQLIAVKTCNYPTQFMAGNRAEQNPEDWWRAVCDSSKEIASMVNPQDIMAVSFSAQSHGCLIVDQNGQPLRPSIIYCDNRAFEQANQLRADLSDWEYYQITGNKISPILPLFKLMWIKENEPDLYEKTYKAVNAKDYIVCRMTGNLVTDVSDAANTGACDIRSLQWSDQILDAAGIDRNKMPEIQPSTYKAGRISPEVAKLTGLVPGTPVIIGSSDGSCAAIGAGCVNESNAYLYIGSSAWISLTSQNLVFDPDMNTSISAFSVPNHYLHYGTMQTACTAYNWLKDQICACEMSTAKKSGQNVYQLMNQLIEQSPPGANGVIYHPYLMGERAPRWNSEATASFLNIRITTKHEDLMRSVLEGISYNLRIIYEALSSVSRIPELTAIGGGAKGDVWCQMLSDIMFCSVHRPHDLDEATSMGAAIIGGVGAGIYADFSAVNRFIKKDSHFMPIPANRQVYNDTYQAFNASYDALSTIYPLFSSLMTKEA